MKRLIFTFLTLVLVLPMMAQDSYISNSRKIDGDRIGDADQYGVILYSKYNDLVIEVPNKSKPVEIKSEGLDAEGFYEYSINMDPFDTHQPKIDVSRRGDLYTTHITSEVLRPGHVIGYLVEGVSRPIRCEDQTGTTDFAYDKTTAEIELATTVKDLSVTCAPELGAKITSSDDAKDKTKKIIRVIIPINIVLSEKQKLADAKVKYDNLQKEMDAIFKSGKDVSDEQDKVYQDLGAQIQRDEANFNHLTTVDLYAEGSNHQTIDISGFEPKMKRYYIVMPLVKTVEKFVTKCQGFVSEGGKLFAARNYSGARAAYVNALGASDVEASMKPAINKNIEDCDSCMRFDARSTFAIRQIIKLRKDGTATQQQTADYASKAVDFLTKLNDYNPSLFYTGWIDKLNRLLKDMPLRIRFTMVEWLTLSEGAPMQNVEVWAYYGSSPLTPSDLSSNRRFKKIISKEASNFVQEGVSDVNGKVEVDLDRTKVPTGFVFCPVNDQVKMVYKSFNDFMRQSIGDYLERQIRLKLYKRTNKYF